jgi:hypothetical protein
MDHNGLCKYILGEEKTLVELEEAGIIINVVCKRPLAAKTLTVYGKKKKLFVEF